MHKFYKRKLSHSLYLTHQNTLEAVHLLVLILKLEHLLTQIKRIIFLLAYTDFRLQNKSVYSEYFKFKIVSLAVINNDQPSNYRICSILLIGSRKKNTNLSIFLHIHSFIIKLLFYTIKTLVCINSCSV